MDIIVEVPDFVADDLVKGGLATRTRPSRGAGDVVQVALSVISLSADTVALTLARHAIKDAWVRVIGSLRRHPKAQILTLQVGGFLTLTVDLDELPTGASRRDQVAPMVNAALDLIDVVVKGG